MTMKMLNGYNKKPEGYVYWFFQSLILFNSIKAEMHRHYQMEIYIGLGCDFKMNFGYGWGVYRAVIIESDQAHQFDGSGGWCALLLLDQTSKIGKYLRKEILCGNNFRELDMGPINPFIDVLLGYCGHAVSCSDAQEVFNNILRALTSNALTIEPLNKRVVDIIKMLRELPEKRIKAADLAKKINLSESRLAHIFKEETGVPIRQFLLWLRLNDAVKLIINGSSYTDAAYEAGFADAAHLTRSYKKMFGLTLSHAVNKSRNVEFITYFNH
jgi:AraC-like DNA-binding protein